MVDIKMYMSEISKFKISDLKAQKMIILWTMKHVSAIRKHPVSMTNPPIPFLGLKMAKNGVYRAFLLSMVPNSGS